MFQSNSQFLRCLRQFTHYYEQPIEDKNELGLKKLSLNWLNNYELMNKKILQKNFISVASKASKFELPALWKCIT